MAKTSTSRQTAAPAALDRIGVGIDTARYGHRVSFRRPDHQPAAKPLTVMETQAGYQALQEQLERLHRQHPQAQFHVRIELPSRRSDDQSAGLSVTALVLPTLLRMIEHPRGVRAVALFLAVG